MSYIKAALAGVEVTLHSAASAAARGVVLAIPPSITKHTLIIKCLAGVASGAIQPETADVYNYAGTWAPVGGGPITVPAASSELVYNFEGQFPFLSARISTLIGGGTVTVIYIGSH